MRRVPSSVIWAKPLHRKIFGQENGPRRPCDQAIERCIQTAAMRLVPVLLETVCLTGDGGFGPSPMLSGGSICVRMHDALAAPVVHQELTLKGGINVCSGEEFGWSPFGSG